HETKGLDGRIALFLDVGGAKLAGLRRHHRSGPREPCQGGAGACRQAPARKSNPAQGRHGRLLWNPAIIIVFLSPPEKKLAGFSGRDRRAGTGRGPLGGGRRAESRTKVIFSRGTPPLRARLFLRRPVHETIAVAEAAIGPDDETTFPI